MSHIYNKSCKLACLIITLIIGPGVLFNPRPILAQTAPALVALSGTAAPAGGNYNLFSEPVLNGSGQVAFGCTLTGGTSTRGLFTGSIGALQTTALRGTAAPAGGNYFDFQAQTLNGSGQVAFYADLSGGSSTHGVFVGSPGAIQTAAVQGTSAPGGGTYSRMFGPVLNGSGQVAFYSDLTGGTSTRGLFVGAPGTLQAVALQGAAAPAGGNYSDFATPLINGSGQVAFQGFLSGGTSSQGIFVGAPGAVQAVALQGTATPNGGIYSGFTRPLLNGSGQVSFHAGITSGSSPGGLFVGSAGSVQVAALTNTAAPAGGNYSGFDSDSVLNGAGQVAFLASLSGGSSTQGVFVGAPGAVQAAALQGTAAPGGGNFDFFNRVTLNGSGQVAIRSRLSGPGVTAANDEGLYAGSIGGIVKVVREGDQVDVDPGTGVLLRTVANGGIGFVTFSGGQDGSYVTFADNGSLAYRLTFTDGSSGIFISFVPVPEPASVLLAGGAFMGLITLATKRKAMNVGKKVS